MIRSLVRQLLLEEPDLVSAIPAERWIQRGSVTETPPRPFAVLGFSGTFKTITPIHKYRLEVWIHDERGDYSFIDGVLEKVKGAMTYAAGAKDSDCSITQVDWISDSPDLYDDGYRTATRSAAFDVVGREL